MSTLVFLFALFVASVNSLKVINIDGKGPFNYALNKCSLIEVRSVVTGRDLHDITDSGIFSCSSINELTNIATDISTQPFQERIPKSVYYASNSPDNCTVNQLLVNITSLSFEDGFLLDQSGSCASRFDTLLQTNSIVVDTTNKSLIDLFSPITDTFTFEFSLRRGATIFSSTWNYTVDNETIMSFQISQATVVFCLRTAGSSFECVSNAATISTNTERHYAFSYNSTHMNTFFAGSQLLNSLQKPGRLVIGNAATFMFNSSQNVGLFNVRIWSVARSQSNINTYKDLLISPTLNSPNGLIAYWLRGETLEEVVTGLNPILATLSFSITSATKKYVACPNNKYRSTTSIDGKIPIEIPDCSVCPSNTESYEGSTVVGDCVCIRGYALNSVCEECPINTYKSIRGNQACTNCSSIRITHGITGAISDSSCLCPLGHKDVLGTCEQCPENTYQDLKGAFDCISCPLNSSSPLGSTSINLCLCNPGYERNGNFCVECGINKYKNTTSNSACLSCPLNQVTLTNTSDTCVCSPGYEKNGEDCIACGNNTYKTTTSNAKCGNCPSNSVTLSTGTILINNCLCIEGFERIGDNCQACNTSTYKSSKSNDMCQSCPSNSIALNNGSVTISDCLCNPGYERKPGDLCGACPLNFFKSVASNGLCTNCSTNRVTTTNASTSCVCDAGFEFNGTDCNACRVDYFKKDKSNGVCLMCPAFSSSLTLTGQSDCICNAGYERIGDLCHACPIGYFKASAGNNNCTMCPTLSTTSKNASTFCECVKGSEGNGVVCTECAINFFKSNISNTNCTPCGVFSSTNGLTGREVCLCDIGYELLGSCSPCVSNFYKNTIGNHNCLTCPQNSNTTSNGSEKCTCFPGYEAQGVTQCSACGVNMYKPNYGDSTCLNCFEFSTTMNSNSSTDCFCIPGYERTGPSTCSPCQENFYKSSDGNGMCVNCEDNAVSAKASSKCLCEIGYERLNGNCSICPVNSYKVGINDNICQNCTMYSTTLTLFGQSDCVCDAGYSRNGTFCESCQLNFYKPDAGNVNCMNCPANSVSLSSASTNCLCIPGFEGNGTVCTACGKNTYKSVIGNFPCISCPSDSRSNGDSCSCNAGYEWNGSECMPCAINFYKSSEGNTTSCIACPSNSLNFQNASSDCYCKIGYGFDGKNCIECSSFSYKSTVNNTECMNCTENSVSSKSRDICECIPGHQPLAGKCSPCQANTFKNIQSNSECSKCPENTVSVIGQTVCKCKAGYVGQPDSCTALPNSPSQPQGTPVVITIRILNIKFSWYGSNVDLFNIIFRNSMAQILSLSVERIEVNTVSAGSVIAKFTATGDANSIESTANEKLKGEGRADIPYFDNLPAEAYENPEQGASINKQDTVIEKKSLPLGAIIGGAVGGFFGLLLIVIIIVVIAKMSKKGSSSNNSNSKSTTSSKQDQKSTTKSDKAGMNMETIE